MKLLLRSVVLALLTISVYAQTNQPSASGWSAKSKRTAEDAVASRIVKMRVVAKRPALKRVNPSMRELQLVCTAALTGQKVGDPVFGGLETYPTDDPSAETEPLKEMTLGRFYPAKKWPRYSVIVELGAHSKPSISSTSSASRVGQVRLWSSSPRFSLTSHLRA
jgi:hypothetical protein